MKKRLVSMAAVLMLLLTVVSAPVHAVKRWSIGSALKISSGVGGTQTASNPAAYLFRPVTSDGTVSVEEFSLLDDSDPDNSGFFVLAAKEYGLEPWYKVQNADTTKMNPGDENCVMYYLNTTLLNNTEGYTFDDGVKKHLKEVSWKTEDRVDEYEYFDAKLSLLSVEEYVKYYTKFGYRMLNYNNNLDYYGFWKLRTPGGSGWNLIGINGNTGYFEPLSWGEQGLYRVRPCFWLDKDYFKTQKIDLASAGSEVKEMLKRVYTREDLEGAGYTKYELDELFPSAAETITSVSISGDPRPGRTLTADVITESGEPGHYSYEWQTADAADGVYTKVSADAAWVVTNAYAEKYVKVNVTANGTDSNSKESAPVLIGKTLMKAGDGTPLPTGQKTVDPDAYKFYPANSEYGFSLLDADSEGNMFILAGISYGKRANDKVKMNITDTASVANYLNTTVLNGETDPKFDEGMKAHLIDYTWLSDMKDGDDYEHTAKLALLSVEEYFQYADKFGYRIGGYETSYWWTRSFSGGGNRLAVNGVTGKFYTDVGSLDVRPCFWLDRDYFKKNKINLDISGSEVLKAIRVTYPRTEMEETKLYEKAELDKIYVTGEITTATNVKIQGAAAVGQTLRGSYVYSSSSSAPETGTVYAWYISEDGTTWTKIDGADSKEYVVKAEDFGKMIKFGVTVRSSDGALTDEVLSDATAAIAEQKPLTVNFKELRDPNGEVVTTLPGQTSLTAAFTATNISGETKNISLILALYTSSNQMLKCSVESVAAAVNTNEYTVSLSGLEIKEGYIVRAMALNDMKNIQPLCGYETN